jgi:RNA polymerase sigma-70 factor (ECF subfamily)
MEQISDIQYVERVQDGDTAAFACLLDRYGGKVFTLMLRILRNREDAEELTQDVFMKVYRHIGSFKGDSSFSTWLYRVAYNAAVSETRKRRQEFCAVDDAVIGNVSEEEIDVRMGRSDDTERMERLDEALSVLEAGDRALIHLFYMEGKSVEETAAVTGLSRSNVKTKIFRIRKKLYILLNETRDD